MLIVASLSAVLYRHWLSTPALEYLAVEQWRTVAVIVAVAIGAGGAWLKWKASILTYGAVVGILLAALGLNGKLRAT